MKNYFVKNSGVIVFVVGFVLLLLGMAGMAYLVDQVAAEQTEYMQTQIIKLADVTQDVQNMAFELDTLREEVGDITEPAPRLNGDEAEFYRGIYAICTVKLKQTPEVCNSLVGNARKAGAYEAPTPGFQWPPIIAEGGS